jgi:hypothetical protein
MENISNAETRGSIVINLAHEMIPQKARNSPTPGGPARAYSGTGYGQENQSQMKIEAGEKNDREDRLW